MLFLQHQMMIDSYCFLPSTFQKSEFIKNKFCVLLKLKIGLMDHERFFFDKTQNGGVSQDGGFQ
jgi:hypothetical protein